MAISRYRVRRKIDVDKMDNESSAGVKRRKLRDIEMLTGEFKGLLEKESGRIKYCTREECKIRTPAERKMKDKWCHGH